MFKFISFVVFFTCFTAKILRAQNDDEYSNADLIFSNFSIQALEESNYRGFPGQQTEKMFVIVAFITANWFKAQEICSYQGLSLASINSQTEGDALQSYLTRAGFNSNNDVFWIGGSKLADGHRWVWLNTGRPLTYNNWALGEPNNLGGKEECIYIRFNGWNDAPCKNEALFICETRCPLTSYDSPIYK